MKKRKFLVVFMCFVIVCQLFNVQVSAGKSVSELKREIENYRNQLSQLDEDMAQQSQYQRTLSKQIEALFKQIKVLDRTISDLDVQISEKQADVNRLNNRISENEQRIEEMNKDIDALELSKKSIEDRLLERMKEDYVYEKSGALEVLLSSEDFGDFVSNIVYLKKVAEFDKKLTDELEEQEEKINNEKAKMEAVISSINSDREKVLASLNELQEKSRELTEAKNSKKTANDELNGQLKKSTCKSEIMERVRNRVQHAKEIAQGQLEDATNTIMTLQSKNSANYSGPIDSGGYLFPVEAPYYIYRGYNPSIRHYGVDIATHGRNNRIFAARGGQVIASRFGVRGDGLGGYGNVVVIDHGDGYSTLYGHMLQRYVSVGQTVSRGQCIGLVGNTGDSNGEHCHFELRISGRPIRTPFG